MGIFGKQRQQQPQYGGTVNSGMGNTWGVTPDMVLEKAIDPQPKRGGMFGGVGTLRGIAGVIGDALLQSSGSRPVFAPAMMQRQQAEAEARQAEAQRRASLEDYRAKKGIDAEYDTPDLPPMIRDLQAWQAMTPEQRRAYEAMNDARGGNVTITLPNQQVYSGPRSGLADVLRGGQAAPTAPVGKLTPIAPTVENTPAPSLGGNGMPAVLTPDQYQAVVNRMGAQATQAWMQRNNVRIGN